MTAIVDTPPQPEEQSVARGPGFTIQRMGKPQNWDIRRNNKRTESQKRKQGISCKILTKGKGSYWGGFWKFVKCWRENNWWCWRQFDYVEVTGGKWQGVASPPTLCSSDWPVTRGQIVFPGKIDCGDKWWWDSIMIAAWGKWLFPAIFSQFCL